MDRIEDKETLKFITCGSVDDGKSTLIGRLLYDKKAIYTDQIEELKKATKKYSDTNEQLDLSLLLDGLSSEREQKITIDVSYKYFETNKRKFIIADTPGHEQYTKNMVTGASNAKLAIILVNGKKGILDQSIRHSLICSFLKIKNIILAINKMDLINYNASKFMKISEQFNDLVKNFGFESVYSIPISALYGHNVVKKSKDLNWFKGQTLINYLEKIRIKKKTNKKFIFPVQLVSTDSKNKRRYLGTIRSGNLKIGDKVFLMPYKEENTIKTIYFSNKKVTNAQDGQPLSLELKKEIDVSRGDILCSQPTDFEISDELEANIIWLDKKQAFIGRLYYIKIGYNLFGAQIIKINHKINIKTGLEEKSNTLSINDLSVVEISLEKKITISSYEENKKLGSFILIDRVNNNTLAAGMINKVSTNSKNIFYNSSTVSKNDRNKLKGHKSKVLWLTGMSGAGKSTLANMLEIKLYKKGIHSYILDGDNLRKGINKDLSFSEEARIENIRRVAEISKLMYEAGIVVIIALISPYETDRVMAKQLFKKNDFIEIYVQASLSTLEKRDVKGLYLKARKGKIKDFTGIDSPYEIPSSPDITINTETMSKEDAANYLYNKVSKILRVNNN